MAENNAAVFTSKGQELLINCMKNSDTLTFTRICIGNGKYSSTSELVTATTLKGEAQLSVPISSSLIRSDNSLCLTSYISNKGLKEGFRITEVGVFAKDSSNNEILYCICPIDEQYANFIPAFNGYAESKIVENIYVTVADASSTKVVVQDGIYATLDYVNKTFATKDEVSESISHYAAKYSPFEYINLKDGDLETVKLFDNNGSPLSEVVNNYMNLQESSEKVITFLDETCILKTVSGRNEPYQILLCISSKKVYFRQATYVGGHGVGHYTYDDFIKG